MNLTITIDKLADSVALATQSDRAYVLNFIRQTFALAAEMLSEGESVEIPRLGTFMGVEGTLQFRPDPELAEAINAPFAAFSAVELPDNYHDDDDAEIEAPEQEEAIEELAPAPTATGMDEPIELETAESSSDESDGQSDHTDPQPIEPETETPAAPEETLNERSGNNWIMPLLLALLCLTVGFVMGRLSAPQKIVYVDYPELPTEAPADTVAEISEPMESPADSSATMPPAEPEKQVLDTIRAGRFLTTMARQHYGQMEYWVYIYIENQSKLGNPDRLEAGTVVVIPPASKYGLIAGDEAKIEEAKRLAEQIYKKTLTI